MENRTQFHHDNWALIPVIQTDIESISEDFSGQKELDAFFKYDCLAFEKGLFLKTYKFISLTEPNEILGLVSLCNHSITFEYQQRNIHIPEEKFGLISYPAVKIERLAIRKEFQNLGYGTILIQLIKEFFVFENRTGCRFIVTDSLITAIEFYIKNEFILIDEFNEPDFEELDPDSDTVTMFFNLLK